MKPAIVGAEPLRAGARAPFPGSLDLLAEVSVLEQPARVLSAHGVDLHALPSLVERARRELPPEPADWHHRLGGRPRVEGEGLTALLAIARTAECQAFALLEHMGVQGPTLRRAIAEAARLERSPSPNAVDARPRRANAGSPADVRPARTERGGAGASAHDARARAGDRPHRGMRDGKRVEGGTGQACAPPHRSPRVAAPADAREGRRTSAPEGPRPSEWARVGDRDERVSGAGARPASLFGERLGERPDGERGPQRARGLPVRASEGMDRVLLGPSDEEGSADPHAGDPFVRGAALDASLVATASGERGRASARGDSAQAQVEGGLVGLRRLDPCDPAHACWGRDVPLASLADALTRAQPRPVAVIAEPGAGRRTLVCEVARVIDAPIVAIPVAQYEDLAPLADALERVARAGAIAMIEGLEHFAGDVPPPALSALVRAWALATPRTITIASPDLLLRMDAWLPGVGDRFERIELPPLASAHVFAAVRHAATKILATHGLAIAPTESVDDLTRIAERHLTRPALPGRALDLLDLACARARRQGRGRVGREEWTAITAERTGLSVERLAGRGDREALDLAPALSRVVVGHEHAIATIAELVRRNRAGFGGQRPIGSVLLLGPSGVGKTELAKAVALALFQRGDALVRLDMSEYSESHAVARIVGAPPGYVGFERGGALSDPIAENPHRVILLDEIEKAHREVHQLLLQILDDGRMTDGRGRTLDLRHAVVIMTSNLGARLLEAEPTVGDERVLETARAAFPVELFNRIEAPLVLRPLTRVQLAQVCRRLATASSKRLEHERGIAYALDDDVIEDLVDVAGQDPSLGARPLRHLLSREIESRIAEAVLKGRLRAGQAARVVRGAQGLVVVADARPALGDRH